MLSSNKQIFYNNNLSLYKKIKLYNDLKKLNFKNINFKIFLEACKMELISPNIFFLNKIYNPNVKNINKIYIMNLLIIIIIFNEEQKFSKPLEYINKNIENYNIKNKIEDKIKKNFLNMKLYNNFFKEIHPLILKSSEIFHLIIKNNVNVILYAYSLSALNYLIYKKIKKEISLIEYTKLKLFIMEKMHYYISKISPFLYNNFIIQNNYYIKLIFKKHKVKYG